MIDYLSEVNNNNDTAEALIEKVSSHFKTNYNNRILNLISKNQSIFPTASE